MLSNPIAALEKRKWEIMKELESFKQQIINDLSGVDKETLTNLRKLFASHDVSSFNEKISELQKLVEKSVSNNEATSKETKTEVELLLETFKKEIYSNVSSMNEDAVSAIYKELVEIRASLTSNFESKSAEIENMLKNKFAEYEETQRSVLMKSRTLTGSIVCVDNASQFTQELDVKTSKHDIVFKYGLNLVDYPSHVKNISGFSISSDKTIRGTVNAFAVNGQYGIPSPFVGSTLHLSCQIANESEGNVYLRVRRADGSRVDGEFLNFASSTYRKAELSFECQEGDRFFITGSNSSSILHVKDVMLSINKDFPYEDYRQRVVKYADNEGNISGIEVSGENFTLVSNDHNTISVTYYMDLISVLEELQEKINN